MNPRQSHQVLLALASAALLSLAAPATAQSLQQRVDALRAQHAEAARPELSPRTRILQKLLYSEITIGFLDVPIRDVMEYFRIVLDVNLVGRYLDDRIGFGIDPAIRITFTAEKIKAIDALEFVLEECSTLDEECTWQIRKGILEVGTKERLSVPAAQDVRVYPIDDLLYVPGHFDNARPLGLNQYYDDGPFGPYRGRYSPPDYYYGRRGPASGAIGGAPRRTTDDSPNSAGKKRERADEIMDMISMVIEPDAWERNGGNWASISHREGALVVRAPDFIQRQIGGYGNVPRPVRERATAAPGTLAPSAPSVPSEPKTP